ncbi:MAG: translation initiation factor IF-3 [Evtepia gabavorous]
MDYGKYRFEQTKRDKEAKKNQRIVEIKEVRMSPGIDVNDFNVKVRNAQRFLADGNRVKVAVRFRGREMAHTDIGKRLLEKFAADCAEVATMDKEPKLDGRHMTMFLSCRQNKETKK